ncbi:hypothetical protein LCGC14_2349590 [marine sediment metagenome]|uniref:Uncharacterized protein n=1 Tax=marine sediment metagenome TaxID=412755 RepID=A0A0F9CAB1_9ZZZZ
MLGKFLLSIIVLAGATYLVMELLRLIIQSLAFKYQPELYMELSFLIIGWMIAMIVAGVKIWK